MSSYVLLKRAAALAKGGQKVKMRLCVHCDTASFPPQVPALGLGFDKI